jgi:predicted lipoprotein with Yx(FWY)xxD motif
MRAINIAGSLLAMGVLAAACGNSGNSASSSSQPGTPAAAPSGSTSMSASAPAPASTMGATAVDSKKVDLGTILVDNKGMTLYLFEKDKKNKSSCYGGCASLWPPLTTSGNPTPGTGIKASWLGTTKRTDGTTQVTYNGWPLYYYAADKKPGDLAGQDLDSFGADWYVLGSQTGQKLEKEK